MTEFEYKTGPHPLCYIKPVKIIQIIFGVLFLHSFNGFKNNLISVTLSEAWWHWENAALKALLLHWLDGAAVRGGQGLCHLINVDLALCPCHLCQNCVAVVTQCPWELNQRLKGTQGLCAASYN